MLHPAHLLRNEKLASSLAENPVPLVILICLSWTLLGLVGHDPWKPDEAHTFGVVYHLMQSGDWVVTMLAGLAMGLYALALSARRPLIAGFWLGTGLGLMFFSTGLVEPLMPLAT